MSMGSYMGKLLYVDLGAGEARTEALDPKVAHAFLGGFGLNMRLAYDLIPPGIDALSPQNVIILGAGPLTGTMAPGSARISATTKFPQSNTIGGGNGGVRTGAQVKLAGYDAIIVSGKASQPVYLRIDDDKVALRPAQALWGKDIYESTEALWAAEGSGAGVMAIGQAGERLSKLALAFMDKIAATGRGGLGAVMGSKNLKALVVSGSNDVGVADSKRFMKLVNRYFERIRNYPLHPEWISIGMQRTWADTMLHEGAVREAGTAMVGLEEADRLCGVSSYLSFRKANFACFSCPMSDKEIIEIKEGEAKGLVTYASSFSGKLEAFVTVFGIHSTAQSIQCLNACQRYGLDMQDLLAVMDQVIYWYEQGVITPADTGGVALRRDFDTTMLLIEWTALRTGLGDVMAEGLDAVLRRFGQDARRAAPAMKGWSSYFDPRVTGLGTMEFEMVVNPRGGHHTSGGGPAYSTGSSVEKFASHANRMGAPDEAVARILDPAVGFNAGRFTRYSEDWYAVLNALGMCVRLQMNRFHSIGALAELYSSATGMETAPRELATAGERAWNVQRAWSAREGFSRKDDRFPDRWFEPIDAPSGRRLELRHYFGQSIGRADAERMLDDYYDERGWDQRSGMPTAEKLAALGLDEVAEDLTRRGCLRS